MAEQHRAEIVMDGQNPIAALGDSLRLGAEYDAEALAKFELAVEDLADQEAALLGAYLQDDVAAAKSYWQELTDEVWLLEHRAARWLLGSADPSVIDWLKLDYRIHRPAFQRLAGETVSDTELCCVGCGAKVALVEATELQPCHSCDGEVFVAVASEIPQ